MSDNWQREVALPVGFEIDGETCKIVTLRMPTAGDMIAINKDQELQTLLKNPGNIGSGNMLADIAGVGSMMTLAGVLIPRLVVSSDSIDKARFNRKFIADMAVPDVIKLITEAFELLGSTMGGEAASPLAGTASQLQT